MHNFLQVDLALSGLRAVAQLELPGTRGTQVPGYPGTDSIRICIPVPGYGCGYPLSVSYGYPDNVTYKIFKIYFSKTFFKLVIFFSWRAPQHHILPMHSLCQHCTGMSSAFLFFLFYTVPCSLMTAACSRMPRTAPCSGGAAAARYRSPACLRRCGRGPRAATRARAPPS